MPLSKKIGLILGIFTAGVIFFFGNFDPANENVTITAAIASLMAIWWITEALPLAATSLIPLIFFPLTGILTAEEVAGSYINSIIFLFIGGFLIAIAMEEWGLHKRIALNIISLFGSTPSSIIIGFMVAAAFLSMWISNTATALMLLPIALAVTSKLENEFGTENLHSFSLVFMLAIAYACTLGGIGTLVGTPPNLVFVQIFKEYYPGFPEITFGQWMILSVPISLIMLVAVAFLLLKVFYKKNQHLTINKQFVKDEYRRLGPMTMEELSVSIIFASTALLWILRSDLNFGIMIVPGWSNLVPFPEYINDGTVAITMSFILFLIPSKRSKRTLLDNTSFKKIPWAIVILFGGGFALAHGFISSGLSSFIGEQLTGFSSFPHLLILIITAATVSFLTELTSNTATTQMILPILASVSIAIGMNPILLMITATLSASMAFMLPVATPPNTIIFASGRIKIYEMARTGVMLNVIGIIVVSLIVFFFGEVVFDFGSLSALTGTN